MKEIAKLSLTFCFIWFLANYFYNYGLLYATITSSVVLSNTSPVWVYLIAISCLVPGATREKFNCLKALAIVVSLAGFSIIALEDSKGDAGESEKPVLGDVLSLVGAVCYALYATYLRVKVPPEKDADFKFSYFLGFVGLFNDILLVPLFIIFDMTGFETFEWPNGKTLMLLSVNAFFGTLISDYCWARSVCLLGPLVTTLGITITFPISGVYDHLVNKDKFTVTYFLGSLLIFAAFGVIIFFDHKEEKERRRRSKLDAERAGHLFEEDERASLLESTDNGTSLGDRTRTETRSGSVNEGKSNN